MPGNHNGKGRNAAGLPVPKIYPGWRKNQLSSTTSPATTESHPEEEEVTEYNSSSNEKLAKVTDS